MYSGSHRGFSLKRRPKQYPVLSQQTRFRGALQFCGIRKGISKKDLQEKMKMCIPKYFKEGNERGDQNLHR